MPARAPDDAIALLKADHRRVEKLFDKFQSTRDAARKEALVKEICTELLIHTTIEDEIFYPACRGEIEEDTIDEAYVEHDGAKILISELLESQPDAEFYVAKVTVLSEMIKHHVKEEERRAEGMFAQAKAAGLDMVELGEALKARKKQLLGAFKTDGLPAPVTRSFTGHHVEQGTVPAGS